MAYSSSRVGLAVCVTDTAVVVAVHLLWYWYRLEAGVECNSIADETGVGGYILLMTAAESHSLFCWMCDSQYASDS